MQDAPERRRLKHADHQVAAADDGVAIQQRGVKPLALNGVVYVFRKVRNSSGAAGKAIQFY